MINRSSYEEFDKTLIAIALFVTLVLVCCSKNVFARPSTAITVNEVGMTRVDYVVSVEGNLSIIIQLLGAPDPTLGVLVLDEKGLPLAFQINQVINSLTVATLNSSQVYISYYTQDLTTKTGIFWVLNVDSPYELRVVLPPNVIPIDMNILPNDVYSSEKSLVLEYPPGKMQLKYALMYQSAAPPQAVIPQKPLTPPQQLSQPLQTPLDYLLLILPFMVIIILTVIVIVRARSKLAPGLIILILLTGMTCLSSAPQVNTAAGCLAQSAQNLQTLVHCRNQVLQNATNSNPALTTILNLTSTADSYLASVQHHLNAGNISHAVNCAILALRTYGLALDLQEKLRTLLGVSFAPCKAVLALEQANLTAQLFGNRVRNETCELPTDFYPLFVAINVSLQRVSEIGNIASKAASNGYNTSNVTRLLDQAKQLLTEAQSLALSCFTDESAKKLAEAKRFISLASSELAITGAMRVISESRSYGLLMNESVFPRLLEALRRKHFEEFLLNKTLETLIVITGNADELIKSKSYPRQMRLFIEKLQQKVQEPYKQVAQQALGLISEAISLAERAPELAKNDPKEFQRQAQSIVNKAKQNLLYPIRVTLFDWSGRPLKNMMIVAIPYGSKTSPNPVSYDFTVENGNAVLYVPPGEQRYQLLVYWRDSYLLRLAGKIPREIVIFDTATDYDTPRTYAPGSGTTLETFVYVGIVMLKNAQGQALSPDILSKITVEIQWPDQVVTTHKPENDGRVPIILNKNTAKLWPLDASANRSPDTDPRDISQVPPGVYRVIVYLEDKGKIAEQTIEIIKGRFETPFQVFEIRLQV